jgi:2-phospho-L-lactate guanylyltransferase
MPMSAPWTAVVPVKHTSIAKTRLTSDDARLRRHLALAFAADTVGAIVRCDSVLDVVVVTDDPDARRVTSDLGAHVVGDTPDRGLNPALVHGLDVARRRRPAHGVVMISSDLPALRPDELAHALDEAGRHAVAFVSDTAGTGTTALMCRSDARVVPHFGARSRAWHRSAGYAEVRSTTIPTVRRDVDTWTDLWDARRLGVGPATRAWQQRG